jgi:hypothetical protein
VTKRLKYPRTVAALVDQDYVAKLSQEDRAFLDKFNEEFYGASFDAAPLHRDLTQRRELFVDKNRRNQDLYGKGQRSKGAECMAPEEKDWSSPVDTPEYRKALSDFRALLPKDKRKKVRVTPEFMRLRAELESQLGIKTRDAGGGAMEDKKPNEKKIRQLKATRQTIFNIGVTVAKHQFAGEEAKAVVEMNQWLEAVHGKVVEKLKGLGVTLKDMGLPENFNG